MHGCGVLRLPIAALSRLPSKTHESRSATRATTTTVDAHRVARAGGEALDDSSRALVWEARESVRPRRPMRCVRRPES